MEAIDENDNKSPFEHFNSSWNLYNSKVVFGRNIVFEFLHKNYLCKSSIMLRKSLFDKYGKFNEKLITAYDLELWLRMIPSAKVARCEAVLTYYRWHNRNETSVNNDRIRTELLLILDKYIETLRTQKQRKLIDKYLESINLCFEENHLYKGYLALQLLKKMYSIDDTYDIFSKEKLLNILYKAIQNSSGNQESKKIEIKSYNKKTRELLRKLIPFKVRGAVKNFLRIK